MKWRVLSVVCAAIFMSALWKPACSQNYYLVVGAFASQGNDIKEFTSHLPGSLSDTAYTVQTSESLMHFYVMKTSSKEVAIEKSQKLQKIIESQDHDSGTTAQSAALTASGPEAKYPAGSVMEPETVIASAAVNNEVSLPSPPAALPKPRGQYFRFSISKPDGNVLPGSVHYVDFEKGRELGSYSADAYIDVLRPVQNKPMPLVCGVFGYKEVTKFIDYTNPALTEGAYQDEQGAWVIPYTLERLEAGDVSVMYNLSFYKDAVMMLPGSKKDLDELVTMMLENPDYHIRVHAHCNGKNSRKILVMKDATGFFSASGTIHKKGSAKELTVLRGETVRDYLAQHGIDQGRVKIYGWGGTEMLVDENSPYAKLNDRIEIEILKD